jgi:hypothetical protein
MICVDRCCSILPASRRTYSAFCEYFAGEAPGPRLPCVTISHAGERVAAVARTGDGGMWQAGRWRFSGSGRGRAGKAGRVRDYGTGAWSREFFL